MCQGLLRSTITDSLHSPRSISILLIEQRCAVEEDLLNPQRRCTISGGEARDRNLVPRLQCIPAPPIASGYAEWAREPGRPRYNRSILSRHVEENEYVRINKLKICDGSHDTDRLVHVVLGGRPMMGKRHHGEQQNCCRSRTDSKDFGPHMLPRNLTHYRAIAWSQLTVVTICKYTYPERCPEPSQLRSGNEKKCESVARVAVLPRSLWDCCSRASGLAADRKVTCRSAGRSSE